MSDAVITVENLSKCYMVGRNATPAERNPTLRDALARSASGYARKTRDIVRGRPIIQGQRLEEFWALKDVSFEVNAGDTLGIIGRNGAGKSTVLKILSRITEPTKGRIAITGRVASLLEVGTGFHPELTGRQNIYLNGAILGMTRTEIKRKFDEIVSFAEVETFLDTPVKRYSSGMYVRLAFAVAAHLEPEILIVDEVLAVGDAAFQKRCLGKMDEFGRQGRTVLFVSHNMAMISNLCRQGMVLDAGKVEFTGHVSDAVMRYYAASRPAVERTRNAFVSDTAELLHSELLGVSGVSGVSEVTIHDDVTVRMKYRITAETDGRCVPNFHFFTSDGTCAFVAAPVDLNKQTAGTYNADCIVPGHFLNEGTYFVGVALTTHFDDRPYKIEFYDKNALTFNVIDPMDEGSDRYSYAGPMPGVVRPQLEWHIERDSE
jgi:homopolymeric O-antigen transport system ATP-binding protein